MDEGHFTEGDETDNSAVYCGAAYVFVKTGGVWAQEAYLKASNAEAGDQFGWTTAISGDTIVIGAGKEDSVATGINGDESDNTAAESGAAYVFVRNGGIWTQSTYLKASNTGPGDKFGAHPPTLSFGVAVDGDTIAVGAVDEDSSATGIGGNELDNGALMSGAAYVFR